jgi:hypothetical protein
VGGTVNDVDSGGTDGYNWSYYGLRRLADSASNGTIFVAPQGINNESWAGSPTDASTSATPRPPTVPAASDGRKEP